MKTKPYLELFSAIAAVFLAAWPFSATLAIPASGLIAMPPQDASGCYALDIVFIIDQSKSMKGIPSGPNQALANDPVGNRYYAPRYALDWLANNVLGLCSKAVHRVGVVSFGTEAKIDLPMTKIAPVDQSAWSSTKEVLHNKIQPQDLDATDPAKAFKEAYLMLKTAPPQGDLPRKRAIISLTDGKACVPTLGCRAAGDGMDHQAYNTRFINQVAADFAFSDALKAQDEALSNAAQLYGGLGNVPDNVKNDILREFPVSPEDLQNSTYIWIIAMNSAEPYLDTDGQALTQIAESHGGKLIPLPENRIAVPREFNKILSWLSGISPTILGCGKLAVDPYLGGATLDVYKAGVGYELKITHNGKTLVRGQGDTEYFGVIDYSELGVIERYRFEKPPAGLWQVDASDCESVEVSYIPFRSKVSMIAPLNVLPNYNLNGATSDPAHPFYLEYKIVDANGNLTLDEDPLYPLDIKALIGLPDGTSQDVRFSFTGAGVWKSSEAIPVNVVGTYTVDLSAHASCVENPDLPRSRCASPTFMVVQDASGKYEVGNINLFDFQVLSPKEQDILPLHGNLWSDQLATQPVSVAVQLIDANNSPLPADTVFTGDLNNAFMATLAASNGDSQTMDMQRDPADPSRYVAVFTSPAVLGQHTITIDMVSDYRFETYSPVRNQASITFLRADSLLNNPSFYTALGILLALLLVMLIAWFVAQRQNAVRGRLILTDISTNTSKTHSLSQQKRVVKITRGLPAGISRIEVSNAGDQAGKQIIQLRVKPGAGMPILDRKLVDGTEMPVTQTLRAKYEWGGRPRSNSSSSKPKRR